MVKSIGGRKRFISVSTIRKEMGPVDVRVASIFGPTGPENVNGYEGTTLPKTLREERKSSKGGPVSGYLWGERGDGLVAAGFCGVCRELCSPVHGGKQGGEGGRLGNGQGK